MMRKENHMPLGLGPSLQNMRMPCRSQLPPSMPPSPQKIADALRRGPARPDAFHVIHKVPQGDSPYVRAKRVQLVDKDPDRAIALFWCAINSGDRVDSALKDMAIVMKQQNRPEEAIEAIRSLRFRCTEQAQESLDNVLLDLYKRCGRLDDQIALLKHKLNLIHQGLAFNGKRTKTARSQGKKFQVSIEQEATRLLGNLGWAYMQQNKFAAAEVVYRKALSIEPDNNKVCNLGICLMKQGRLGEAQTLLDSVATGVWGSESHLKSFERAQEMLAELRRARGPEPGGGVSTHARVGLPHMILAAGPTGCPPLLPPGVGIRPSWSDALSAATAGFECFEAAAGQAGGAAGEGEVSIPPSPVPASPSRRENLWARAAAESARMPPSPGDASSVLTAVGTPEPRVRGGGGLRGGAAPWQPPVSRVPLTLDRTNELSNGQQPALDSLLFPSSFHSVDASNEVSLSSSPQENMGMGMQPLTPNAHSACVWGPPGSPAFSGKRTRVPTPSSRSLAAPHAYDSHSVLLNTEALSLADDDVPADSARCFSPKRLDLSFLSASEVYNEVGTTETAGGAQPSTAASSPAGLFFMGLREGCLPCAGPLLEVKRQRRLRVFQEMTLLSPSTGPEPSRAMAVGH